LFFDGWVLSFSHGYTRRANSIHPLYPSTLPLADKIVACEGIYAAKERPTTFKVTSAADDVDLDQALDQRGYARVALTSVQLADLRSLATPTSNEVALSTELDDPWFDDFNRLTVTPEPLQASERSLLEKIAPPHAFASVAVDGETVAVGLAVAEHGYVGLFDIVVDSRVRNRGLGRRLCTALLRWAANDHAVAIAYLAVMADNAPALRLYQNLGFREAYTYWYRRYTAPELLDG
jgi:ribosomal protein S18 acetylase RimI-like enzyme